MKLVVRSLSAIAVAAALAVPFVQFEAYDAATGYTSERGKAVALKKNSRQQQQDLPAIYRRLSTRTQDVPDFAEIYDVNERKREFFAYLLPAIEETNQRILAQREMLATLHDKYRAGETLSREERDWISRLADYYRVDADSMQQRFQVLARRVDIVPETVVLIQAANESGWGTSRFAREGLNFFGQWCWTEGCGIVPAARPDGQVYEVRRFESMEASVVAFVRNLNTHFAYQELRAMRLEERQMDDRVSSDTITAGLMSYSERGQDYIDELNQMIRINQPIIEEVQSAWLDVGI
ncbi:glucosaminidase domain-containing protein [Aliidiomarina maris]|uniref:Bax protein n=1 Tax=Aliidiomarina maris TaxID=531312 RepID=A0A327WYT2_9GAMM|nr:glucosaminidase domain-containing protein [Aliidiomarina maris]RAJ98910.1 Bax protein [Aliidiomarina maris]RUO25053.1 peptidoglycan hydrolase [Aliidiomarina maris]